MPQPRGCQKCLLCEHAVAFQREQPIETFRNSPIQGLKSRLERILFKGKKSPAWEWATSRDNL
jgi:hypothetical protein